MSNLAFTSPVDSDAEISLENSPFLLENESEYRLWRNQKLDRYQKFNPAGAVVIPADVVKPPLSKNTLKIFAEQVRAYNFAVFQVEPCQEQWSKANFLEFGCQLGLHRLDYNHGAESDGVTLLSALDASDERSRYIPYTNRALNWHTDGYYNRADSSIAAFSLYCARQAQHGGSNFLLDHEMLYIQIRDTAPELLEALMDPGIMVVPANIRDKQIIRPAESGPVFRIDGINGALSMRFSSRPQNIGWKADPLSERAVNLVRELLIDNEFMVELKLESGQGMVCNNVLHGRTAFVDGSSSDTARLYYRARYYDLIQFSNG